MSTAASPRHFGRTILRTCGAAATRPGSGFFFPRTRGGRCVSASKHRLPEGTGWDAVVAFHGGFLAHSARPGTGALENRYWRRRGSGKSTTRSQSDDATSKQKGGAGGYDCIPKVAVRVPLDTVLDVFLVRASPADAKPIASRGLYRPISDRAAPPALASGRRALEMGLEMGWNLPCWGPCSPDGQAAAGVGVCQWRARTGSRVFKLRQDASGECKEEQDNDNPSLPARLISALLPGHIRSDIPISPPPSWKKVSSLPPSPSGRRMETAIKSSVESILGLEHMSHGAMAGQYGPGLSGPSWP